MADHDLCASEDIAEGAAKGFVAGRTLLLVVRKAGALHAYVNSCPHIGTPLDFSPDRFLSFDAQYILCSTHGALFEIDSGECVSGPCAGDSLDPLPVREEAGRVTVTVP